MRTIIKHGEKVLRHMADGPPWREIETIDVGGVRYYPVSAEVLGWSSGLVQTVRVVPVAEMVFGRD